MKKNVTTILTAVVALAVGYLLGSNFGLGGADAAQTKGDINAVNSYHQLLSDPEYMAFSKANATDAAAIERSINTLTIVESRIGEFFTLGVLTKTVATNNAEVQAMAKDLIKVCEKAPIVQEETHQALMAAKQLQAGEEVNLKKAAKQATEAYNALTDQMTAGRNFVKAADEYLQDKDLLEHVMLATLRDMIVSHCAVNASLTQNDSEMDYWMNINGLLTHEQMAFDK